MIGRRALLPAAAAVAARTAPAGIRSGLAQSSVAQSYPDRPIKLVVPFPAGGPVDVTARIVAQPLLPIVGQPGGHRRTAAAPPARSEPSSSPAPSRTATRCCAATSARSWSPRCSTATATTTPPRRLRRSPSSRRATRCWWCIQFSGQLGAGADRLRQGQPGQAQLRIRRARATPAISRRKAGSSSRPASTSCTCPYKGAAGGHRDPGRHKCRCISAISAACCR